MAAISYTTGSVTMLGPLDLSAVAQVSSELEPGTVLAVADTEDELRDLARRVALGARELERRDARRKQQKASRRANR